MRALISPRPRAALWLAPSVSIFLAVISNGALAQDDPFATEAPSGDAGDKPTDGAKGPEHASLTKPKVAAPEAPPPVGPFERLPPTAYTEWTSRGLHGGSLWLSGNFHGMPWPYYPKTGIGVSGYGWLDTGYQRVDAGQENSPDRAYLVSQGRGALRISPTYSSGDWYVQAQAELIANKDQAASQPAVADVDDLWVRTGQWKKWDLQVGRFEAYEVYHFGMGLDLNTLERLGALDPMTRQPPDVYGLTSIVYRQSGVGNVAFHLYPTENIRFELLGQFGFATDIPLNTVGARPAIVIDYGWVKLKLAGDVRKQFPIASSSKESRFQRGGMGALQFVFDPIVEFGANFAYGLIDHYNPVNVTDPSADMGDFDGLGSPTLWSAGGFLNLRAFPGFLIGGGGNFNHEADQAGGEFTHLQTFGAIQYLVGGQLFVKLVAAYAQAHLAPGGLTAWDNTMMSGRIRLMYLF